MPKFAALLDEMNRGGGWAGHDSHLGIAAGGTERHCVLCERTGAVSSLQSPASQTYCHHTEATSCKGCVKIASLSRNICWTVYSFESFWVRELLQRGLSRCLSNTVDNTDGGIFLWTKGTSAKPNAYSHVQGISSIILAGFKFSRI